MPPMCGSTAPTCLRSDRRAAIRGCAPSFSARFPHEGGAKPRSFPHFHFATEKRPMHEAGLRTARGPAFLCIYPAVLHFQDIYVDFPPDKSIFFSVN